MGKEPLQMALIGNDFTPANDIHMNALPRVSEPSCDDLVCERTSINIYKTFSVSSEGFIAGGMHSQNGRCRDTVTGACGPELESPITVSLFSMSVSQEHSQDVYDFTSENDRDHSVCNAISQSTPSCMDGDEEHLPSSGMPSWKEGRQENPIPCKTHEIGKKRARELDELDVKERKQSKTLANEQKKLDFKRWTSPRRKQVDSPKITPQANDTEEHCILRGQGSRTKQPIDNESECDSDCTGETLRSFRDRLFLKKQIDSSKKKTIEKNAGPRESENIGKCKYMLRPLRDTPKRSYGESHSKEIGTPRASSELITRSQLRGKSHSKEINTPKTKSEAVPLDEPSHLLAESHTKEVKAPKELLRDIAKEALLEAGFKIELRPRESRNYNDSVYVSPEGQVCWSLPKAWEILKSEMSSKSMVNKEEVWDVGGMHSQVDKNTLERVLLGFGQDERLLSALKQLCCFHCADIQDIVSQVEVTNAKLADILLVDLGFFRRITSKAKRMRKMQSSKLSTSFDKRDEKKRKSSNRYVSVQGARTASSHKITSRMKQVQAKRDMMQWKQTTKGLQGKLQASKTRSPIVFNNLRKKNRKEASKKHSFQNISDLTKQKSSSKKGEKAKTRTGFRLEVRPPKFSSNKGVDGSLCNRKQTIFSWMIDRGAMREKKKIYCVSRRNKKTLKEGIVTQEGIMCRCCKKVYTSSGFESHAGKPHCSLIFASGSSLLDCQVKAWKNEVNARKTKNYVGVSVADPNDDTCILCGDGGDLVCCDRCPSTFHMSCLRIDSIPEGAWYCPKCRCGSCGSCDHSKEEEVTMIQCSQCEHRYHVPCLDGGTIVAGKLSFCSSACEKIFSTLRKLIGVVHPLDGGLSWSLLRCSDEDDVALPVDIKARVEQHCKLAVALLVIEECFNPMVDPRTNIDMITQALYNRRLEFDRLNYGGFYTAILERDCEIISVATIRVHGTRLAEMPLIGTRETHRRQGMCRLLVGVIEELLRSLEVGTFILPAIPELFDTWTQAFGFRPLDDASERLELRDLGMMMFPGTELLQKPLLAFCETDTIVDCKTVLDSVLGENTEQKEISDSSGTQNEKILSKEISESARTQNEKIHSKEISDSAGTQNEKVLSKDVSDSAGTQNEKILSMKISDSAGIQNEKILSMEISDSAVTQNEKILSKEMSDSAGIQNEKILSKDVSDSAETQNEKVLLMEISDSAGIGTQNGKIFLKEISDSAGTQNEKSLLKEISDSARILNEKILLEEIPDLAGTQKEKILLEEIPDLAGTQNEKILSEEISDLGGLQNEKILSKERSDSAGVQNEKKELDSVLTQNKKQESDSVLRQNDEQSKEMNLVLIHNDEQNKELNLALIHNDEHRPKNQIQH